MYVKLQFFFVKWDNYSTVIKFSIKDFVWFFGLKWQYYFHWVEHILLTLMPKGSDTSSKNLDSPLLVEYIIYHTAYS